MSRSHLETWSGEGRLLYPPRKGTNLVPWTALTREKLRATKRQTARPPGDFRRSMGLQLISETAQTLVTKSPVGVAILWAPAVEPEAKL